MKPTAHRPVLAVSLVVLTAALALPASGRKEGVPEGARARVELAILLDTSGSMDGLINQARSTLWGVVNQLATTKKNGRIPELRVALYEYGNQGTDSRDQIRQVLPLTTDLDAVSEALFKLSTNGGDEYCGQVIKRAVTELEWTAGDHYRGIFIAGNEPFTQGTVHWKEAVAAATSRGIVVNAIHCGKEAEGRAGSWHAAAEIARGSFTNIDQNAAVAHVTTPFDGRIAELGGQLNQTYVAYGAAGREKKARQARMDEAAESAAPAAAAQRSLAKGSAHYRADSWDLVDGAKSGSVNLAEVKDEALPAEMQGMSAKEREAFVAKKRAEREKIQAELRELQKKREAFVAKERKKSATRTFDAALEESLGSQMEAAGFQME